MPNNYLITINGEILCTDEVDESRVAGRLRLFYVLDMEAAAKPFYNVFFNSKTNEFKSSVHRLAREDIYSLNLLILDRLEILPAYRGRRPGLVTLYRCMQQFGHGVGR